MVRAIAGTGGGVSIKKQIQALGWDLEMYQPNADVSQFMDYRACQGGFCTPWRYSADEVLKDLQEQARIEKALDKAEAKLR
jgi:hypothetical protein